MKLLAVVGLTSLGHALAQTTDAFSSIFPDFGSTDVPDVGTVTSLGQPASLSTSRPGTTVVDTSRSTPGVDASTTPLAATTTTPGASTISPSLSLSQSGTLVIITAPAEVSTATPASSSPTPTPAGASARGDRVAVIALSSILGALVIGLVILALVLLQRRKLRPTDREGSIPPRHGRSGPSALARLRPTSWVSSLRRGGRGSPSDPRHHLAAATSQPLMSEGSPVYGFHPPPRGPNPAKRPMVHGDAGVGARLLHDGGTHDLEDHPESITPFTPTAAVALTRHDQPPGSNPARTSARSKAGHPYTSSYPAPTEPSQFAAGGRPGKDTDRGTGSGVPRGHALASHPMPSTTTTAASNGLPGPQQNAKSAQSTRTSSIPRERLADAMAGMGIGTPSPEETAKSEQSIVAEPSQPVRDRSPDDPSPNDPRPLQKTPSPPKKVIAAHSRRRTQVPRLLIPSSLVPGRKFSKRTRFSVPGHDDISPTTESWLGADDAARGHGRRPSTVSPVSSEAGMHRTPSHTYPYPRAQYVKPSVTDDTPNPGPPATASTLRHVRSDQTSGPPSHLPPATTPGTHPAEQSGGHGQPTQQPSAPPQSSRSPDGIKRKPVPYDLATLVRKPLPPHPVPTSKYNQAARQSTKLQASQAQDPSPILPRTRAAGENRVHNPRTEQPVTAPPSASTTVYDQMVRGMSGMQANQRPPDTNGGRNQPQIQESRPQAEVADLHPVGSGYPQAAPRNPSAQAGTWQQQTQPSGGPNRNTVPFFEDPSNREYAQVYGSYYSQSSPVEFRSPTSPQHPVSGASAPSQLQARQMQPLRDRPPTGQLSLFPRDPAPLVPRSEREHEVPRAGPARPVPEPSATSARHEPYYPELSTQNPWRDSRQDAWRDSLSRSGSDHASTSANDASSGRGGTVSSAGGARTGLWGSPGFFGAEQKKS